MATNKLTTLEQLRLLAVKFNAELAERDAEIDEIVTAGGEPNKIDEVRVNGVAVEIANKIVDILIATGSANGTLAVAGADVAVKGLAALAYKAEVSEAELSAALKAAINAKAAQSDLDTVSGKVTTLIGSDTGKSARTIANEELAKQLVAEGAAESLNTLEEIAAWIQQHPNDASAMNKAISDLEAYVGTIPEDATATDIVGYIQEAITNLNDAIAGEDYVTGEQLSIELGNYETDTNNKLANKVDKVEGKGLSTNDYTTDEKTKLAGIAEGATKVAKSTTNGNVLVNGAEVVVYTLPSDVIQGEWATDDEVNTMLTEVFGA